jgi:hypothetical protein
MSLTKVTYSMIDGPEINVVDLGADPTGVADSYPAFLAAYNSGAGVITVPLGEFRLSTTLMLDRAIIIQGSSSSGVREFPTLSTSLINFTGTGAAFELVGSEANGTRNVHIKDLSIQGSASGTCGILVGNSAPSGYATMSSVINVQIKGFTATNACGLHVKDSINCYFRNVSCFSNYDGVKCQGENTTITFESCWATTNLRYGWFLDTVIITAVFTLCIGENNQDAGLYIRGNVSNLLFNEYHSEINNRSTGLAPQVITSIGATLTDNPRYINFMGGYFGDSVGATFKSFDITGGYYINWYNPTLTSYSAGFMSVTSTTTACNFDSTIATFPNRITGNTVSGVTVNSNLSRSIAVSIPDGGSFALPSGLTSGVILITDLTNNHSAILVLNGSGNSVSLMADPDSAFATSSVAGKVYIGYISAAYRIGQNTGGDIELVYQALNQYPY